MELAYRGYTIFPQWGDSPAVGSTILSSVKALRSFPSKSFEEHYWDVRSTFIRERTLRVEEGRDMWSPIVSEGILKVDGRTNDGGHYALSMTLKLLMEGMEKPEICGSHGCGQIWMFGRGG